jgi:release factor glutamine methyltransferase
LALKQHFANSQVLATDISMQALTVARQNAMNLNLDVSFAEGDLWAALPEQTAPFDVIVSNPPYISYQEEAVMDYSVRHFEPATALFAADNGLALYQRIATSVQSYLKPAGRLFMEFGYQQAPEIEAIFQAGTTGGRC